jgi:hypothetical protein
VGAVPPPLAFDHALVWLVPARAAARRRTADSVSQPKCGV